MIIKGKAIDRFCYSKCYSMLFLRKLLRPFRKILKEFFSTIQKMFQFFLVLFWGAITVVFINMFLNAHYEEFKQYKFEHEKKSSHFPPQNTIKRRKTWLLEWLKL
jgi:magnesium-transporting ATPase (P-type)